MSDCVVSLFDGLGGARIALDRVGWDGPYYRAEIDKWATKVHMANWPESINLGDVRNVSRENVPARPLLLIGGSPCQDLSSARIMGARGRAGLKGEKSSLFWEYVRVLRELRPESFIFENVGSMHADDEAVVTSTLGVQPITIDAAAFVAQRRVRHFWVGGLQVDPLPTDGGPKLVDVLDTNADVDLLLSKRAVAYLKRPSGESQRTPWQRHGISCESPKSRTLVANLRRGVPYNALKDCNGDYRKLSVREVERLFGVPEGYVDDVEGVPEGEKYRMLGNGYVVPVIEHLLKNF